MTDDLAALIPRAVATDATLGRAAPLGAGHLPDALLDLRGLAEVLGQLGPALEPLVAAEVGHAEHVDLFRLEAAMPGQDLRQGEAVVEDAVEAVALGLLDELGSRHLTRAVERRLELAEPGEVEVEGVTGAAARASARPALGSGSRLLHGFSGVRGG